MTRQRAIILIAISGLLVGCGSTSVDQTGAEAAPTPTRPATVSTPASVATPEPGAVSVRGERVKGEWEDGDLRGKPLEIDRPSLPYAEILYAAQPPTGAPYV